jgi:hypothetical protein
MRPGQESYWNTAGRGEKVSTRGGHFPRREAPTPSVTSKPMCCAELPGSLTRTFRGVAPQSSLAQPRGWTLALYHTGRGSEKVRRPGAATTRIRTNPAYRGRVPEWFAKP